MDQDTEPPAVQASASGGDIETKIAETDVQINDAHLLHPPCHLNNANNGATAGCRIGPSCMYAAFEGHATSPE
jgi:hypothetical protein